MKTYATDSSAARRCPKRGRNQGFGTCQPPHLRGYEESADFRKIVRGAYIVNELELTGDSKTRFGLKPTDTIWSFTAELPLGSHVNSQAGV